MQLKVELVPVPVADIDRAMRFYTDQAGFVLDVDVTPAEGVRFVQLTPPGSACSISLSRGVPALDRMRPGSLHGVHLVVDDIVATRIELQDRGVEVAEITDVGGGVKYAEFADPDGNTMLLQEMAWRTGDDY
jgi:predicted enzyme related to lactoylglutathione lyase